MKGYNIAGYALIAAYALACMYFAPPDIGPWTGLLIGAAYFVACWFIGGLYLSSRDPSWGSPIARSTTRSGSSRRSRS